MSTIKVLDKGYVTLVDHWGDDNRPANTARTSYNDAGKTFSEARNKGLSDYLIRHNHNTPVEFNAILFYMKMPIFVARQWVRHRTQSLNEISYRYVQAQREFYIPDRSRMALQSTDNKQGSSDILIENPELSYGDPESENILIHGDNLLALKALEQEYAGKVKCIYIDPPYNTGNAFEHYDD